MTHRFQCQELPLFRTVLLRECFFPALQLLRLTHRLLSYTRRTPWTTKNTFYAIQWWSVFSTRQPVQNFTGLEAYLFHKSHGLQQLPLPTLNTTKVWATSWSQGLLTLFGSQWLQEWMLNLSRLKSLQLNSQWPMMRSKILRFREMWLPFSTKIRSDTWNTHHQERLTNFSKRRSPQQTSITIPVYKWQ